MRPRLAVILSTVVVAAVMPAGVAHAKGLTGLTACGANGCVDRGDLLRHDPAMAEALLSASTSVADPGPAPYLVLQGRMGHDGEDLGGVETVYFPSLGIQGFGDGTFHRVDAVPRRALDAALRGLRPFPAGDGERAPTPADADVVAAVAQARAAGPPSAPKPKPAPVPAATPRVASGDDGGGVPTAGWIGGGAALALAAAIVAVAIHRRRGAPTGRPATG